MARTTQRLDKILSNMGYGTRKEVKDLVKARLVTVDGVVVRDPSAHADPMAQRIAVDGKEVEYREFIYLMMNKPMGVVSATEDNRDETVLDLLEEEHRFFEPFPVGRLDKDTVGLLILTNDGDLAHNLLSPKKHVGKTYYAEVAGIVGPKEQEAFKGGVVLDDGYKTLPADLRVLEQGDEPGLLSASQTREGISRVLVSICEGKFHQIKRMFEAVGMKVEYLKRLKMGPLTLDNGLEPGEYRELTEEEAALLKNSSANPA